MKNIEKINDYIQVLNNKITFLINNRENLFVLFWIISIFCCTWLISKLIIKKFHNKSSHYSLVLNLTMPILLLFNLTIFNLFYILFDTNSNPLIPFFVQISIAMIVINLITSILKHIFALKKNSQTAIKLLQVVLWFAAILLITDSNNDIIYLLDNITFKIGKNTEFSIWDILYGITVLICALLISILTNQFLEKRIYSLKNINTNLQQILIRLSKIIIYVVAFMVALTMIGIDMTALSVLGGAIGVGIGFGLQKIASNFLSGFIILFDRSIKVGDRLVVDNHAGLVEKITMRYVVLERFDGTEVLIPNETFVTSSIQNQSYSSTKLRGEILCGISDDNDIIATLSLLKLKLKTVPNTIADKVSVNINKIIDGGVELKCQFWVENTTELSNVTNLVYVAIIECFKNNQIIAPTSSKKIELINHG